MVSEICTIALDYLIMNLSCAIIFIGGCWIFVTALKTHSNKIITMIKLSAKYKIKYKWYEYL